MNIKSPKLTITLATFQEFSLPLRSVLVKTGINADEKVPKTRTSNTKSGSRKAAKKSESSEAGKKCAKVLCLMSPKTLEATIISIIIVAADNTEDCGFVKKLLPLVKILLTI